MSTVNGAKIPDTQLQPNYTTDGQRLFALVDSGGPTMLFPSDTMAAITNAWGANPNVCAFLPQDLCQHD